MVTFMVSNSIRRKISDHERRLKRIERVLEFLPTVTSFDWKDFWVRDKAILSTLLKAGRRGITTTEIARELGLENPETSGRAIVWKRLRRIEKISIQLKGFPLVRLARKRWSLNYDDFSFAIKKK